MVNLPKSYLSYSAWALWHKNKNQFRKRYYENEPSFETRESIFGKRIAALLEEKKYDSTLAKVPRGKKTEFEINTHIGDIPILCYLDSCTEKTKSLFEIKTGRIRWNQKRVNMHDQLVFYAMAIQARFGSYDPFTLLCWLETELVGRKETIGGIDFENDDQRDKLVQLTGRMMVWTRKITPRQINKMKKSVWQTAQEINNDWEEWKKLSPAPVAIKDEIV